MATVKELDYDKLHIVKVIIRAGFPTPFEKAAGKDSVALDWNPFNRSKDLRKMATGEKVHHIVSVEKLHYPIREMKLLAEDIREYHRKDPGARKKADMFELVEDMSEEEIIYIINTWMAIARHFGNGARYRREFIGMMRPLPEVLCRVGL